MTFEDEFEGLVALRDVLREWDDRYACTVRVELRPRNKHSDEDLVDEEDRPRLFLETIRFEVEQAVECAQLAHTLRTLAGDRSFSIHVGGTAPLGLADSCPTRPVRPPKRDLGGLPWILFWAIVFGSLPYLIGV